MALCGPAGCGKTRAARREYVERVRAEGEDSALLLLPTQLACRRTRLGLLEDGSFPALFDPRILTFPQLADLLLRVNGEAVARISGWQQHLLMRQVAGELSRAGELPALAPMCDFPGFVAELCSLVDELKRAAVDPQQFARAVATGRPDDARSRELALIYGAYQGLLQERGVFDEAGRFWQARDVLLRGERRPFEELRLIVADGFDDFTTTQLQVLRELAAGGGVERLLVTVCLEQDGARRPELFHVPRATLDALGRNFPGLREDWSCAPDCAGGPLVALERDLFAADPPAAEAQPEGVVELIEAPGRRAEVRQVALRVKGLIRDEGARPERIGIMARDLSGYRQALVEVFHEAGLPLDLAGQAPVAARPSVQAVLDILRVPMDGLRCADVMRLLKSNYVDLTALQPADPIEPDEVERIARAAGIIRGDREQWRRRLQAYRAKVDSQLEDRTRRGLDEEEEWLRGSIEKLQRERGAIERAEMLLTALFDAFALLPDEDTPAELVEALYRLIERLGIEASSGRAADPRVAAANIRALSAFLGALRDLWAVDRVLGLTQPMALAEFGADVIRMASGVVCQQACRAEGGVLVVSVEDARQLDFDHVFVLGMTEREFPRAQRESPLYSDDERGQLAQTGVPLEPRLSDRLREAFLFYQAVTAAHRRLWLSYPTVDPEGHELLRSHYVEELERCFGAQVPRHRHDLSQVVADFDALAGPTDLLQRSIFELCGRDLVGERRTEQALSGLRLLAGSEPELLSALAAAIEVEDRRESAQPPDEYDGALGAAATLAQLAEEFGPEQPLSPGGLNEYGRCPFAFFASRVLGLEELGDVTEDADAALLGTVRHRCLSRFFRQWGQDRPLDEQALSAAREVMTGIVDEVFRETRALHVVGDPEVFAVMRGEVERDLHLWLDFEVEKVQSKGHTATDLEASFGYGRVPPLVVGEGDGRVLLRGRIDRVDRFAVDGVPAFAVYDYKSSKGESPRRIEEGRDFQLPAYALAARELIVQDPRARCREWGYYKVHRPIYLRGSPSAEEIEHYIARMCSWALVHAASIRAGRFAPAPQDCRNCQFRSLCRWDQWRFEHKQQPGGDGDE